MLASIVENAGLVTVIATPQDDTVVVSSANAGFTDISINAGQTAAQFARFTTSQIDKVVVWAGAGNDSVYSSARVPTEVNGQNGDDILQGGLIDDIVRGGGGENRLFGRSGNDTLVGGPAIDRIFGANGHDTIFGNGGNDYLVGHDGDDTLSGGTGNDNIQAGTGNDTVFGGNGNDNIAGHAGMDLIYGNEGHDSINGGAGNDLVAGQDGNDTLNGADGNDIINGSFGDDLLLGFDGNDTLDGGEGVDRLFGGNGEDFLEGGFDTAADRLNGGAQNDTFVKRDRDILEDEDANGLDSLLDYTTGSGNGGGSASVIALDAPVICNQAVHSTVSPPIPVAFGASSTGATTDTAIDVGVDNVVVVVSGFGEFPGVPVNNSQAIASAINGVLVDNQITSSRASIEVVWGQTLPQIQAKISEVKTNNPGKEVVWLALGQGLGFTVETVGRNQRGTVNILNGQLQIFRDRNGLIPTQTENDPAGPAINVGGYDVDNIINGIGLDGTGTPLVEASSDAGQYICDATTYHLNQLNTSGEIDFGIFFHVPPTTTVEQNETFALGVVDSILGAASDPDGDGRVNAEDSFPFNSNLN